MSHTSRPSPGRSVSPVVRILALAGMAFGVLTIFSGGSVLFGPQSARDAAGAVVPFVLWFNFLAGFAYVAAGFGLWRGAAWAPGLALAIFAGTVLIAMGFALHVATGGAYAGRTVGALGLRTGFWALISFVAWKARPDAAGPGRNGEDGA